MIPGLEGLVIVIRVMAPGNLSNEVVWNQFYELGENRLSGEKGTFVHGKFCVVTKSTMKSGASDGPAPFFYKFSPDTNDFEFPISNWG